METNLKFLEQFYLDMQNKMNEKYALIKIERDAWEAEKDEISSLVKLDSEVVSLNIGGNVHIQTEKEVLRSVPNSLLAKMFSDMHELKKINEEVLGELFSYFTLETVITGKLANIDPFNQPAVEQVKIKTKKLLS